MKKEEFIYQYLIKYNEYEEMMKNKTAVEFWKNYDREKGTSGLIFMVLRNSLVHNTEETLSKIKNIKSFSEIIEDLKKCDLQVEDRMKFLSYFLEDEKVKSKLREKNFEMISTSKLDIFKLFQRKENQFYCTLFFSHTNLMFDVNVSTYNHQKGCREFYKGYYIETELYKDQYIIKFFKEDDSFIKYNVNIYINTNFEPQNLYQSIELIDIGIFTYDAKANVDIKLSGLELCEYKRADFSKLFNQYICDSTVREVAKTIKNEYKKLNNCLHVIGVQNDI